MSKVPISNELSKVLLQNAKPFGVYARCTRREDGKVLHIVGSHYMKEAGNYPNTIIIKIFPFVKTIPPLKFEIYKEDLTSNDFKNG